VVEDGQSGGDSPSTEGDDVDEQEEALLPRFVGIGGSTESEAEALVEAGYSTKDDLKEASLEELRSIDGLDDGTALRMKAEFG
jgi:ERCC4-type nuclease